MKDRHALDMLQLFLHKKKPEVSNTVVPSNVASTKSADDVIQLEDGLKFQEYFLKEKAKVANKAKPMSSGIELTVNRELIEQTQESIIEQEESVPAHSFPEEKSFKEEKTRRPSILKMGEHLAPNKLLGIIPSKAQIGGWFQPGRSTVGLKGGADHEKLAGKEKKVSC